MPAFKAVWLQTYSEVQEDPHIVLPCTQGEGIEEFQNWKCRKHFMCLWEFRRGEYFVLCLLVLCSAAPGMWLSSSCPYFKIRSYFCLPNWESEAMLF